ncbi:hypothetical protein J6590_006082 [Homalodisca vitripennis]|nr:hypothetical protein J6590_006082 [Homalodisca vitripennis]
MALRNLSISFMPNHDTDLYKVQSVFIDSVGPPDSKVAPTRSVTNLWNILNTKILLKGQMVDQNLTLTLEDKISTHPKLSHPKARQHLIRKKYSTTNQSELGQTMKRVSFSNNRSGSRSADRSSRSRSRSRSTSPLALEMEPPFQVVKTRREIATDRKRRLQNNLTNNGSSSKKRTRFVTGNSTAQHNLNTIEKTMFLFTSRFSPETKSEDIEQYLTNKKDGKYVVDKLNSKRPDLYSSFKVGIPSQYFNEIYSPEF